MQISANELRRRVTKGYEGLMIMLPAGEETFDVASPELLEQGSYLAILALFSRIADAVSDHYKEDRTPIMHTATKAILAGEEDWYVQRYLD